MVNKPHYKKSKATETNNSHYDKDTDHTKDKEDSPNIEDVDILFKKIIKHLMSLHLQNKVIQLILNKMLQFD